MLLDFTKIPFDVIIQAGQSNSEGCGFGPADLPYEPNERVMYMNRDDTVSMAVERVERGAVQTNFGLSFAREALYRLGKRYFEKFLGFTGHAEEESR